MSYVEVTQLRINHLRRMAQRAYWLHGWYINGSPATPITKIQKINQSRSDKFYCLHKKCQIEIQRLKDLIC
jgi:hypothetical protein